MHLTRRYPLRNKEKVHLVLAVCKYDRSPHKGGYYFLFVTHRHTCLYMLLLKVYNPYKITLFYGVRFMAQSSTLFKVAASGKWESGVKTNISVRNFPTFQTDEPAELGGTDSGPNPMEFVAAALNGCNGVMIPLIANEMNFSFSGIDFETSGIIDIRGLMGEKGVCPHFQKVRFRVNIQTEESEERLHALQKEVERRCPVFNLLLDAGVQIDVKWNKM
jgi:uncharacterized OsmC-like protein